MIKDGLDCLRLTGTASRLFIVIFVRITVQLNSKYRAYKEIKR